MELRQLRYFAKVAELCNFSEAAKALCVTQSTLSQQVKTLEDELGAELLVRDTHRVRLTDVGKAFLPMAKQTLFDASVCEDRISDVKGLVSGTLNVGATYTFSPLLSGMVNEFTKLHPGVKINIVCASMEELMSLLDRQEIDLALSYRPLDQYPNIDSYTLFQNQLAAVMSDTHPLASRQSLSVVDLVHCILALPSVGMQARNVFDRIVASSSDKFNIRIEVGYISVLLDLVENSHMVTVTSMATIRPGRGLVAIPLTDKGSRMEGCYHVKSKVYMKCATREFLRIVEKHKPLDALRHNSCQ